MSLSFEVLQIANNINNVYNNVLKNNNYFAKRSDLVKKVKLFIII